MKNEIKKISIFRKILVAFLKAPGQLILSFLACIFIYVIAFFSKYKINIFFTEQSEFTMYIGILSSILALVSTISFGFLLYFIQNTSSDRSRVFSNLKSFIHDFDKYINSIPEQNILILESRKVAEVLVKLRLTDIPEFNRSWGDNLKEVTRILNEGPNYYSEKVLFYLQEIETYLNELGIIYVRQVVSELFMRTVIKCFVTLSAMIILLVISLVNYNDLSKYVFFSFGLFFGFLCSLFFIEISIHVFRHTKEFAYSMDNKK